MLYLIGGLGVFALLIGLVLSWSGSRFYTELFLVVGAVVLMVAFVSGFCLDGGLFDPSPGGQQGDNRSTT